VRGEKERERTDLEPVDLVDVLGQGAVDELVLFEGGQADKRAVGDFDDEEGPTPACIIQPDTHTQKKN
jgi:hypothetical protein